MRLVTGCNTHGVLSKEISESMLTPLLSYPLAILKTGGFKENTLFFYKSINFYSYTAIKELIVQNQYVGWDKSAMWVDVGRCG